MKKTITLLLVLCALAAQARHVYTIQSGNWEADSVWYNNLKPDTTGDSISIYHHISLNSDIVLSTGSYLFIDRTGWFCGDHSLLMTGWADFLNLGFLGLYYFEMNYATGVNLAPGVLYIGEGGMHLHGIGTSFLNDRGCMKVHYGRQPCCVIDTFLLVTANLNVVNFETHEQPFSYNYDFGDGTTLNTSENYATHTYNDSGEFKIRLIISSCCGSDTVYRKVHIELPEPPPPPCIDRYSYLLYPNPTDDGFWLEKEFCEDEDVLVRIFAITGQLTDVYHFSTNERKLKEYITCRHLAADNYIVDIQSISKNEKLKLVVLYDVK